MQTDGVPGVSVELAKQGSVIYAQGYGYADVGACQPTQSGTSFQLASLTKTFTAAAILQLQSAGSLDIDKPVIAYLPAYPFDPSITLRMLLNHTSGLADYANQPGLFPQSADWWTQGVAEQTILTAIAQAPLQFAPGAEYQYSNSNYFLLGCILETVTADTYVDYMSMNIFQPFGLMGTSTTQPLTAALPYGASVTGSPVELTIFPFSTTFSAGGLWSSVQDLANFDAALFAGQVIPAAQFTEMVTPPSTPSSQYAMGWGRTTVLNRPFVDHSGALPGVATFNGLFLDDGFSVSILINTAPSTPIGNLALQLIQAVCTSSPTVTC